MSLGIGTRIGPYEILGLIGAGGMGEVYRARDPRLGRDVAIKVLPAGFATDPERLQRFEQEARAAAALNHPNILAVYDIGQHASTGSGQAFPYIVSELLDGETLRERLRDGALPPRKAVDYAVQVARGLAAAHEKAIVHRDLKPENIFVTRDERVKILDFGLAKLTQAEPAVGGPSALSTRLPNTLPGTVLGTLGYMAPEQVRGLTTDYRADLFAFGAILYEMLAGMRAFQRETAADVMIAIVKEEPPDMSAGDRTVPPVLDRIVRRCLEKNAAARFKSADDLAFALEGLSAHSAPSVSLPVVERRKTVVGDARVAWSAAAVCLITALALGAFAFVRRAPAASPPPVTRFQMSLQPAESLLGGQGTNALGRPTRVAMALSPDGRSLVFGAVRAGVQQLYLRQLDQLQAMPLAGSEGASSPFFSPDGQWIGFWVGGELKRMPSRGGPPVTICKVRAISGATWADGDVIFFGSIQGLGEGEILRVAATGGQPERIAAPDVSKGEFSYRLPHALPGGKALLFTVTRGPLQWDDAQIVVRSLETGEQKVVTEGADARYLPTGHLVFVRLGALLAAPFDVNQLALTGGAVGLLEGVMQSATGPSTGFDNGAAQITVSSSGTLAYAQGGPFSEDLRSLVWVDREGAATPIAVPLKGYWAPRISPDGGRLAFYTRSPDRRVWIHDFRNGTTTALTDPGNVAFAVWTPDGARVAFSDAASRSLFSRAADGSMASVRLTTGQYSQYPASWSPDGKTLVFVETNPASGNDIWLLELGSGKGTPRTWLNSRFSETRPDWSPDGRWIAYDSDESGRSEVYVQPFPGPGPRYSVSRDGGHSPAWSRDGRELFYVQNADDGLAEIMAVPVTTTSSVTTGTPRRLFEGRFQFTSFSRGYDVAADGGRFVLVQPEERAPLPATEIVVVENWFEELKQKVPATR